MRSITLFAIGLPLLISAQDYPWLKDPNWKPANGWGTPAGGWDSVDYSGGNANAPVAANNQPTSSVAQQSSSAYVAPASSAGDAGGQTTTTTPPPSTTPTTPPPSATPTTPPPSTTPSSTANPAPSSTTATSNSGNGGGNTGTTCSSSQQAIEITNNAGQELVIQAATPWTIGQCSNIAVGATCTICQERGSTGGNLQVGYGKANGRSTWIEGNWDVDAAFPCMDISYIPGYTVPIVCTGSDGSSTIGMSDPLCADEACSNCESGGGQYIDGSCQNPMGDPATVLVDGPAPEFFSSATGTVYTYPNDSHDGYAPVWNSAKCVAHPQFGGKSKRNIEVPKVEQKRDELAAHAHHHIGKRARRHLHKHAMHAGSKF